MHAVLVWFVRQCFRRYAMNGKDARFDVASRIYRALVQKDRCDDFKLGYD